MAVRVILLSDGLAGHYRQSETIVEALRRRREVVLRRIELRNRIPRALVSRLWHVLPSKVFMRLAFGLDPHMADADLIVAAGALTLPALETLGRLSATNTLFSGSPRAIGARRLSLVLTPYASEAAREHTAYLLKPAAVDPDRLPSPRPWQGPGATPKRLGLLIGGPTSQNRFEAADWNDLARLVVATADQLGASWTIVTSRRTPDAAYQALAGIPASAGTKLIDWRAAGSGSIDTAFAADALLVTSDSLSMISEAVAARRPVLVLRPRQLSPGRDDEAVHDLATRKLLAVLPLAGADAAGVDAALAGIAPMAENHLDLLADTIVSRLGL